MPPNFGKQSIKFNTMIDNLRRSKLVIESGSFAAWRARREGGGSSSSAAPAEEGSEEGSEEQQPPRKSPRKLALLPTAEGSDDGSDSDYVGSEGGVP